MTLEQIKGVLRQHWPEAGGQSGLVAHRAAQEDCAAAIVALLPAPTAAVRDVLAERQKQIGKGYTPEHDDEHTPSRILWYGGVVWNRVTRPQLVRLAACAIAAIERYDRGYKLP